MFEWTKWVSGTGLPTWIPPAELAAVKLSVDTTYRYTQTHVGLFTAPSHVERLLLSCLKPVKPVLYGFASRPHIPISKLVLSESYESYISRSFQVTRDILAECKKQGTSSPSAPLSEAAAVASPHSWLGWAVCSKILFEADAGVSINGMEH